MHEILLGEFIGTLILVLLGNGVVAGVLLKGSKAEGGGWIVITAGWAFAVMAGVFTAAACGSNAAHLNPAITLGFALASGDWTKAAPMIVAAATRRICGGMSGVGALLSTLGQDHGLPRRSSTASAPVPPSATRPRTSPVK